MFISIDHLTKDFRGRPAVLDNLTVDLPQGMIGLIGPNGAGKTTLMRILTGIIKPSKGKILIDGQDLSTPVNRRILKRNLGYLPQNITPYDNLSPLEFLDYIGILKMIDDKRVRQQQAHTLLEQVGLEDVMSQHIGGFSGGMRRRVGIAQALMGDPRLLVVDEPTAGLDPEERMRFRTLLAQLGQNRTVILSTHILDDVAQTCPWVCVLRSGRRQYDGPTQGLIHEADGHTWITPPIAAPPDAATIINAEPTPNGTRYRIVTDTPPAGSVETAPNLEDGYMALAREH
ncbi:ATP-binding cassette domain-containing protein [Bifidobacterium indicum]|uniref:ATP-binding cassette domain-containing protein n=1 Tax=Bifidobacterium indicum TaxID=1691 RepID=UPI0030DDB864